MKEVLEQLRELQALDFKLGDLESLRGDFPQQVSRLNRELEGSVRALEEKEAALQAYQKERAMTEVDIKALEDKQKKYQSQLFEVTNNREYDAVTHEIESVKDEIEKKESRILELMDLEEDLSKGIEAAKEESDQLRSQLDVNQAELQKRMAETEKDEAALQDRRGKIVRKITPRILSSYERIRKAKNGTAVAPVIRNACGGCFKSLPPQRILEIRQMDRMYLCEVCGRILVWDEKVAEGQA